MAFFSFSPVHSAARRRFLTTGLYGAAGLALYSGEIARHRFEVTEREVSLVGLPRSFDGIRIAQMSDIHLGEFTEPFFLRHLVDRVNRMQPDAVMLTGDFVTEGIGSKQYELRAANLCAEVLSGLQCRDRFAVLGNHDFGVSAGYVAQVLRDRGIPVLRNASVPLERGGDRIWIAGVDDPVVGQAAPDLAIPPAIRNLPDEPVVFLCHAPDYADTLLEQESGSSVGLMLSGHTHGGQVRLPFLGALELPELGKKYVEGMFRLGAMQLYVNRGIGTIGLPFRLNCPPEITMFTLRKA